MEIRRSSGRSPDESSPHPMSIESSLELRRRFPHSSCPDQLELRLCQCCFHSEQDDLPDDHPSRSSLSDLDHLRASQRSQRSRQSLCSSPSIVSVNFLFPSARDHFSDRSEDVRAVSLPDPGLHRGEKRSGDAIEGKERREGKRRAEVIVFRFNSFSREIKMKHRSRP